MEKKIEKKDRSRRKEGKNYSGMKTENTVEPRSNGIVFITDSYS